MGKIQKLPESLIRLIAAGEVIERPASVIKELLENSLDAGATRIAIDIWGAGRTRIRVADNGCGMAPEDAELALSRHATSKLHSLDDLHSLETFGFRGEALPSIAAVSRLTLSTRAAQADAGWRLELDGGTVRASGPCGMETGTTIDVQDLFFNTPARSKFLKRDGTERSHLLKTVQELALAHPSVRFDVSLDGKEALSLPAAEGLGPRLADVWGIAVSEKLIAIDVHQGPCRVRGFVNRIPAHHPTKAFQMLFVNQRAVQQRALTHAIYEAYHEWLPVGRHPVYALFIDIDPTQVDVNVHPTKREVRFADERAAHDLLYTKIRDLFRQRTDVPEMRASQRPWSGGSERSSLSVMEPAVSPEQASAAVVGQAPLFEPALAEIRRLVPEDIRYLGQFQRVYLLAEQGEELLLIDQHAAAERVLYEALLSSAKGTKAPRQTLLAPLVWETSAELASIVEAYRSELETLGFGLEPFGPSAFALKEWPAGLPQARQAKRFLEEVIEALRDERPTDHTLIRHQIAARAACRAAIMANDPVAPAEALELIRALASCERPMTCPHGRPTHIRLPIDELHRRFRRT